MDSPVSGDIWLATLALAAIVLIALAWSLLRAGRLRAELALARNQLAQEQTGQAALRDSLTQAVADRAAAQALAEASAAEAGRARQQAMQTEQRLSETRDARESADREALKARTERQEIEKRLADWETARTQSIETAKAATLETASRLLTDYKREAAAAKEVTDKTVKDTTEALRQHFEAVAQRVVSLSDQVNATRDQAELVMRALSTPGGAGQFGEIGLENTLKAFGLVAGRDFAMQQSVRDEGLGRTLRPDALVFLPGETVLVIDSKSSKFLLELAAAEGSDDEAAAMGRFAQTMRTQLRSLAGKDYKSALLTAYRQSGRGGEIRRAISVMCLPTDGAVEKLFGIDPQFEAAAQQFDIVVVGPTSLRAIVALSRWQVELGMQAENQQRIVESVEQLLDSVATVVSHAGSVGAGVKSAAKAFVRLTSSVNGRLLPRARKLGELGVRPAGNKQVPGNLPPYQVVDMEDGGVIEVASDEPPPVRALPER